MIEHKEVFVGVPTFAAKEYCFPEFLKAVKRLPFDVMIVDNSVNPLFFKRMCAAIGGGYENVRIEAIGHCFWRGDCSRKRLAMARNIMRDRFLAGPYRYYLSLESDVIVQEAEIWKLVADHTAGVLAALVEREGKDSVISRRIDYQPGRRCLRYNIPFEALEGKITPAKGCHLAMTLIPRAVIEQIRFRYEPSVVMHDDSYFSVDCIQAGFKITCDGHVKPVHLWKSWPRSLII